MDVPKFREALVVIILSTILSTISVMAVQPYYTVTIPSSGSILAPLPSPYCVSEIRGVQIAPGNLPIGDWDLVAQTLTDNNINVVVGVFRVIFEDAPKPGLQEAIDVCHARGIKFHVNHHILGAGPPSAEYETVRDDGSGGGWCCPIKTHDLVIEQAIDLVQNYDVDGYMFDYARYNDGRSCYCSHCKAAFEEWLNETIPDSNWPPNASDFAPGGARHNEFLEWRIIPMTELVRDVRAALLAIKPDLTISAAVWTWLPGNPAGRRKWVGQDWNDWVAKGYLDWACPMVYINDSEAVGDIVDEYHEIATGGPEGKAPVAIYLCMNPQGCDQPTAEEFAAQIDAVRAHHGDGFIIWRYGGPGNRPSDPYNVDIRPYLSIVDMPPTFSLNNIHCAPSGTNVTINWTTDMPVTSKVEYSMSPLFNATKRYYAPENFDYWDIDHINGTILEIRANVTEHSITLTELVPDTLYYYRVQSEGESGIATTKVFTFET